MKIINLHGFLGQADNKNYEALCEIVPQDNIISPKLHYKANTPEDILSALYNMVDCNDYIFVGQSLGGWYADKLSRKFNNPCILINPCYYPHKLAIITESGIPDGYLNQYRELSEQSRNFHAYTLCSDADTILPDNYQDCTMLSSTVRRVHGSHSTIEKLSMYITQAVDFIVMKNQ